MDYEQEVWNRYVDGVATDMMAIEYRQLIEVARTFTERQARRRLAPTLPSALELISELASELLPHGPPPSLVDALHALDLTYARWQGESDAFQRVQARRFAYCLGQLTMLRGALYAGGGSANGHD